MNWFIIESDGKTARNPNVLPQRPVGADEPIGGPFTPYKASAEHRHNDGSYHLMANSVEHAIERIVNEKLETLPIFDVNR